MHSCREMMFHSDPSSPSGAALFSVIPPDVAGAAAPPQSRDSWSWHVRLATGPAEPHDVDFLLGRVPSQVQQPAHLPFGTSEMQEISPIRIQSWNASLRATGPHTRPQFLWLPPHEISQTEPREATRTICL